ncbi:AraC family transcriptional regulator [Acinetobacter baumannii]|jgi:AraC-like DNA-binding protein|nr:AraC family transcriptional regulator [Acinetobacter baumannii]MDC5638206.1 AraC family transcriptional regulator [Acinetobacter baumannii]
MITVELFDPAIFACICSPNFNIAIQRLSEFKRLIGPMQLQVAIDNDTTTLELKFYNVSTPTPQSLAMSELVFFAQLARICTRHQVIPLKVTLPDLPNNLAEYKTFFGVLPQKSEHISIVFSRQDAERPFLTANPTMWSFFEPNLQRSLIQLDEDATVSEKVKAILLENLPAGLCTIEDVAQRLAMSKRTLQRLLLEEQTNFKTLLDTTRQSLAQHYLEKSSMSTGEISFLLGFQEHNSFSRAFKNWTGNTPQEYRLMH